MTRTGPQSKSRPAAISGPSPSVPSVARFCGLDLRARAPLARTPRPSATGGLRWRRSVPPGEVRPRPSFFWVTVVVPVAPTVSKPTPPLGRARQSSRRVLPPPERQARSGVRTWFSHRRHGTKPGCASDNKRHRRPILPGSKICLGSLGDEPCAEEADNNQNHHLDNRPVECRIGKVGAGDDARRGVDHWRELKFQCGPLPVNGHADLLRTRLLDENRSGLGQEPCAFCL